MHCKANCLVRVGADKSDGCNVSDTSCQTITIISRILGIFAMLMMDIDRCVKESLDPQYHSEDSVGTPGKSNHVVRSSLMAIS